MANPTSLTANNRIGFHYFQDTLHYSNQDLATWLPELTRLSASWVVLLSDATRAIPEQFISGLVNARINPIIHFRLQLPDSPSAGELKTILNAYYRWGVRVVVFFDKPNDASSWSSAGWSHQDLVERFMDKFLPLAQEAVRIGLTPVFPPLMPGGSYWDTSFFKSSIQSLQRRGQHSLLEKMAAGSYAYSFGHELTWGEGGPEKWNLVRPYFTPADSQDQRGFNNYTWLESIAASLGVKNMPIIQFAAGIKQPDSYYSPEVHCEIVHSILNKINIVEDATDSTPILASNFWLLAADPASEEYPQAWIKSDAEVLPAVRILTPKAKSQKSSEPVVREDKTPVSVDLDMDDDQHPIDHYVLLPRHAWGVSEWHLDAIRPFILKYQPTVGYSIQEAALARRVTVIDGDKSFSAEVISMLRSNGCVVDEISGDGTSIATQLLER